MAEAGIDPKTLQYIMGHSDISTTMDIYNHVDSVRVQNEMKKFENVMWRSEPFPIIGRGFFVTKIMTNFMTNKRKETKTDET